MSETSRARQKKKVVLLAAGVACMSSGPVLLKDHPVLMGCWLAVMFTGLTFAIIGMMKLKRMQA